MRFSALLFGLLALLAGPLFGSEDLLGLPPLVVPADNPQTDAKIALGDKLFNDTRFSTTGDISCATCHDAKKGLTDSPLKVSNGIKKLQGTRNAPTVANSAFNKTQFWDGRSPSLEDQAQHPFINPVEMGLPNHEPILEIIRKDKDYRTAFEEVFGKSAKNVTITEVTQAIAAFERTQVFGNSPFDRWYFAGEQDAMSDAAKRGFKVFLNEGRCVSCHAMEQNFAVFTDHKFHNIGVGINELGDKVTPLAKAFLTAKANGADVDVTVLTDADTSHLGRFAVSEEISDMGAFKTSTLRNIAVTAPYMHDGSLETLRDVVVHYNNGGVSKEGDPINPFLAGGIKPLDLTDEQIDDLVAFMEALTSPQLDPKATAEHDATATSRVATTE